MANTSSSEACVFGQEGRSVWWGGQGGRHVRQKSMGWGKDGMLGAAWSIHLSMITDRKEEDKEGGKT
jgi:hypothetical protein